MMKIIVPFVVFTISALLISLDDVRSYKVPLSCIYVVLFLLVLYDILFCKERIVVNCIGALINFFVFFIVRLITKKGLGFGDVQYSLLTGYYSGFPMLFFSNLLASFAGLCWFGIYFMRHKTVRKIKVPFAPFMAFGSFSVGILTFFGINNSLFL